MSISCALHYIWQCPTHPPVPHITVSTVISVLILRTGILVAKVKLGRLLSTLNFKCCPLPLWTHWKFYFPLFNSVFCNWDAACPVISVQWSHVQCPHPHELNTNSPGQQLTNEKTVLLVYWPIRCGESMEMLGCLWTYFDHAITTVTPLQLTFVLGYAPSTLYLRPEQK